MSDFPFPSLRLNMLNLSSPLIGKYAIVLMSEGRPGEKVMIP